MIVLTLSDIERELVEIADVLDEWEAWDSSEKLRALASRIAVQVETEKLAAA